MPIDGHEPAEFLYPHEVILVTYERCGVASHLQCDTSSGTRILSQASLRIAAGKFCELPQSATCNRMAVLQARYKQELEAQGISTVV